MSPILGTLIGGVLDKVIDKLTNQLPVSDNEKENIKVQAEKELANHAGTIAEAEATISSNAKEVWLQELHNGGLLATSWRPLSAVTSLGVILWDAILVPVSKGLGWVSLVGPPASTVEVCMWVLLTLIGARGFEKVAIVAKKGK